MWTKYEFIISLNFSSACNFGCEDQAYVHAIENLENVELIAQRFLRCFNDFVWPNPMGSSARRSPQFRGSWPVPVSVLHMQPYKTSNPRDRRALGHTACRLDFTLPSIPCLCNHGLQMNSIQCISSVCSRVFVGTHPNTFKRAISTEGRYQGTMGEEEFQACAILITNLN